MSEKYYVGRNLIFAVNDAGEHLVPDGHWYEYLLERAKAPTPSAVRIFDKVRDVIAELYGFVPEQDHMTPEERRRSF